MYIRNSLEKNIKGNKKKQNCIRKRNKILNFRVSEEELNEINKKIELLSINKQDYFIQLLTKHEVVINADYRIYDNISKEIFRLAQIIKNDGILDDDDSEVLKIVLKIYESIKTEKRLQLRQ